MTWEDEGGTPCGPVTAAKDTNVHTHPRLAVEKTGPAQACPGQLIEYTITLENQGGYEALDVTLTDILPNGLNYQSSNPEADSHNGTVTWDLGKVPGYGRAEISLTVQVDPSAGNGITLVNTAVTAWQYPGGSGQSSGTWQTLICSRPLLTVDKTGPAIVQPGETFNYSIEVCNAGGTDAVNVILTDNLPDGVVYVGSTASGGYADGRVNWDLGTIPADDCTTVTLTLTVNEGLADGTVLENVSSALWSDVAANNYGPAGDVLATKVSASPNLLIQKTGPTKAYNGDQVTYVIRVCNVGQTEAVSAILADILPVGLNYVSSSPEGTFENDILTWGLGTIESAACKEISVTAMAGCALPDWTSVANTASVVWKDTEQNDYGPSIATAWTVLNSAFVLTKTGSPTTVTPGENITFNIEYENIGSSIFSGVVITEVYDQYFRFVSATPQPDADTTNRWTIGELPPGASSTINIVVQVADDVPGGSILRNKVHLTTAQLCRKETTQKTRLVPVPENGPPLGIGGEVAELDRLEIWLVLGLLGISIFFIALRRYVFRKRERSR